MKRMMAIVAVLFELACALPAQTRPRAYPFDWDKWQSGFFLDAGVLGNYEDANPSEGLRIETWFLLFEIGGGYDFGRITFRLYGDFGLPLTGFAYWADGEGYVEDSLDVSNGKFGIEMAVKIVDALVFDILIPFGLVFSKTEYTRKTPEYTESGVAIDRKWIYEYTSIVAGLDFTVRLSNHLKLHITSGAAYPLVSDYTYKEILPKNYVFTATGNREYSVKASADILMFSAGIGLRVNF